VVTAPVAGEIRPLTEVPDPVFATAVVGPGLAIDPAARTQTAVAPVTGHLIKLKPYAFVVVDSIGRAVLVHLGIDTMRLGGEGFVILARQGQPVSAGEPIVRWDPGRVAGRGLSTLCPVVALEAAASAIGDPATGYVVAGDALFTWA
jgi:PTS system glucose-specific IIA component